MSLNAYDIGKFIDPAAFLSSAGGVSSAFPSVDRSSNLRSQQEVPSESLLAAFGQNVPVGPVTDLDGILQFSASLEGTDLHILFRSVTDLARSSEIAGKVAGQRGGQ